MSFLTPDRPKTQRMPLPPSRSDSETQSLADEARMAYYSTFGGRGTSMLAGSSLGVDQSFGAATQLLGGGRL